MNATAERIRGYIRNSTTFASSGTAIFDDNYQAELITAAAADNYKIDVGPAVTAIGHLSRRESTVISSTVSVPKQSIRVAEWDGYVVEVGESSFTAALRGISGESVAGESHDTEIAIDDVGKSDKALLRPGAFFRVCIYFQVDDDERPKRFAKVVFRRLPAYRSVDLYQADRRSEERHRKLRVE
jgi:hypothetical protein